MLPARPPDTTAADPMENWRRVSIARKARLLSIRTHERRYTTHKSPSEFLTHHCGTSLNITCFDRIIDYRHREPTMTTDVHFAWQTDDILSRLAAPSALLINTLCSKRASAVVRCCWKPALRACSRRE